MHLFTFELQLMFVDFEQVIRELCLLLQVVIQLSRETKEKTIEKVISLQFVEISPFQLWGTLSFN